MPLSNLVPVILAGGAGTRLWPVSRDTFPKQLARLTDGASLLQQTAERVVALAAAEHVVTVGAQAHGFMVRDQLGAIDPALQEHQLFEPVGRNTAAAIALAARYACERITQNAVLWVCPSDHLVRQPGVLHGAVERALPVAEAGDLVTFGITPTRPETGYGYIQAGPPRATAPGVCDVKRFVEKPERAVAEAMLAEGGYFWNSGIFLFRADRILAELETHAPDVSSAVEAAFAALAATPAGGWMVPQELYETIPAEPIDRAVMERSANIAVVPCEPEWSDLGSWHALWEQLPKDAAGNAVQGDAVLDEVENCLIRAESRLVACSGVSDLAVVETDDAVLVADRQRPDAMRALVSSLKALGHSEATAHSEEHRPWGRFKVLHEGTTFKVKEIVVTPGGRLSLQSHRHRAEHWVVVAGRAQVTVDDEVSVLEPNQSVHIPLGAKHRMENPGDVPMHLIEVQCGSYLGEDDIIRYEDVYGRS